MRSKKDLNDKDKFDEVDDIQNLKDELEKCKDELKKCQDGWKRERASAINMQKDYEKRLATIRSAGENDVLLRVIEVIDDFEMAVGSKGWDSVDDTWRIGVEMIKSNMERILSDFGVQKMDTQVEDVFDFNKHNAVGAVECSDPEMSGKISRIIKNGYVRGDDVIRPAIVEVYKLKDEKKGQE